ncbi:hypothetical protein [Kribbella sp. NPDC004536]|uniref:hypothetical protein n=1 Tax=Kribbella sp. NPDC004536 TaxID=3364106 RepID=UPI00369CFE18
MPSPDVLSEVRRILDEHRPAEQTIRAIRRLLDPPAAPVPIQRTDRGWPVLRASLSENSELPR